MLVCQSLIAAKGARLNFPLEPTKKFWEHSCLSEQGERATSENAFKRLLCIDSKLPVRLKWRLDHDRKSIHAEMWRLSA